MDSPSLRSLKSAVALSNMGAKLLERRRTCSAESTLKDALFLVRAALPENAKVFSPELDGRMSLALQKASKAVAQSSIEDALTARQQRQEASIAHVLPDSESPVVAILASSQVLLWSQKEDEAHLPVFVFHMEERFYAEESLLSLDLEVATILFNLAAALRSKASVKNTKQHLREAFHLLKLTYTILSRNFADLGAQKDDKIWTSRVLLLSSMVIQNLVILCKDFGIAPADRDRLCQQLYQLHQTYAVLAKNPCWRIQQHNFAPAA